MHREEWIEKRRKTLGASDVPIIVGISPFGNATMSGYPRWVWTAHMKRNQCGWAITFKEEAQS